jgi:hypothetical protein
VQVMIDDRALDPRAIDMLAAILVRQNGDRTTASPAPARGRLSPRREAHRHGAARVKRQRGSEVVRVSPKPGKEDES